MILLVGLGNPGKQYETTRHNAGWMFLDYLKALSESDFEEWKEKKRLNTFITEGTITTVSLRVQPKQSHLARPNEIATVATLPRDDKMRIILAKPTAFMSDSGLAIQKLVTSYEFFDHRPRRHGHPVWRLQDPNQPRISRAPRR